MPQIGWWLLPFIVPFGLSPFKSGRVRWRRTPFDGLLLLFLLTAVIAVWPAYDRVQAAIKLANLVGGLILYYLVAGRPRPAGWLLAGLLGLMGSVVAAAFLLAHNWQTGPADLPVLTRLGIRWMQIRPSLSIPAIHPNQAGGLIALLLPFAMALGLSGWRQKQWSVAGTAVILTGVMAFGLLLTSSRAAWLALAAALLISLLWSLSQKTAQIIPWPPQRAFLLFLALFLLAGLGFSWMIAGGPLALVGHLPGVDSSASRLELYRQTMDLIADFPFTGGGLASFPGLYSQYIAVTPFFLFDYSHNLWLDVAVEQGIAGGLALILLYVGTIGLLWRTVTAVSTPDRPHDDYLVWATAVSLLIIILHGLVDDAVYGGLGTPLLFVLPGMVVALAPAKLPRQTPGFPTRTGRMVGTAVLLLLLMGGLLNYRQLAANWYANWGAVLMARAELADWPTGHWDDGHNLAALAPAQAQLQRAATLNGNNVTAHYRLGLLAMLERNFATAVTHLETAYEQNPNHRGLAKSLGYSYVWSGELAQGFVVLAPISEAGREMAVYSGWWQEQGEADLAQRAAEMAAVLNDA